jgi:hypothetical protein
MAMKNLIMKIQSRGWILGSFLTGALVCSFQALPANASPDPKPAPGDESSIIQNYVRTVGQDFVDKQQKLMEFKGWIISQPGFEEAGYVDQVNDAKALSTRLLWKGPSSLRQKVLDEAKARGINATIEERPHSLPEIRQIAQRLVAEREKLAAYGFKITSVC